jgi:hypothetical protein
VIFDGEGTLIPESDPDHRVTVPFGALYRACSKVGLLARLNLYDGGQTVIVNADHLVIVHVSRDWGDDQTATEAAAEWLLNHNWLKLEHFEGGS